MVEKLRVFGSGSGTDLPQLRYCRSCVLTGQRAVRKSQMVPQSRILHQKMLPLQTNPWASMPAVVEYARFVAPASWQILAVISAIIADFAMLRSAACCRDQVWHSTSVAGRSAPQHRFVRRKCPATGDSSTKSTDEDRVSWLTGGCPPLPSNSGATTGDRLCCNSRTCPETVPGYFERESRSSQAP